MIPSFLRAACRAAFIPALAGAAEDAVLPELPSWTTVVDVSLAAGYRDNLLLSPTRPEKSALLAAAAEVMALKVPVGAFDGYAYLDLSELRYLDGANTDHERSVILAGEARWQPGTVFRGGWTFQAYHQDQVLDVSVTEADLSVAQIRVTGLTTGPTVRWTPGPLWIEAKAGVRRDTYREDLDGYDDAEGGAGLGYTWGHGSELSATVLGRRRDHDSRQQFTVSGRPIAGTRLGTRQTDAQLEWVQAFDAEKRLRLTATLARQWSRDNGSGYFDYDRDTARVRLAWRTADWEHDWEAEASRHLFPVQFVGVGINPDNRRKDEVRLAWSGLRRLRENLAVFVAVEREQSRSNDDRSRFTVNTVRLGVRMTWDSLATAGAAP